LAGSIPSEIQFLHRITKFAVPFNVDIVGTLDGLGLDLEYLTDLELQYCGLTGNVPDWFGNLRSLTNLGLGNNMLGGSLPDSFFALTNLVLLGLDDNTLTGPIAPFAQLTNLESLYLEDNALSGEITTAMIDPGWMKMVELDLSTCLLDGPLPYNLWSIPNLEVVDLHGNDFVGPIPEIDSVHESLFFLALHENKLDWRIPESISNLPNLAHLDVSKNNLVLPFPSTMSQLTKLRYLFTGQNPFENHPIPTWLADMKTLRELSMKGNSITGNIPAFLGGLTSLQVLDLDMNQLEGVIPDVRR
jgi:Leucine-rich repeat (LRR) protein